MSSFLVLPALYNCIVRLILQTFSENLDIIALHRNYVFMDLVAIILVTVGYIEVQICKRRC